MLAPGPSEIVSNATVDECCTKCHQKQDCRGYSLAKLEDKEFGVCTLRTGTGSVCPTVNNQTVTSGFMTARLTEGTV